MLVIHPSVHLFRPQLTWHCCTLAHLSLSLVTALNSDEYEFKFIGHKANECKGREELEVHGYVDLLLPKALECNTSDQLFGGQQTEKKCCRT